MCEGLPRRELTARGVIWCASLSAIVRERPSVSAGQELWAMLDAAPGLPSQLIDRPGNELRALGALAWGAGVRGVRLSGVSCSMSGHGDSLTWSTELPGGGRVLGAGAGYLFRADGGSLRCMRLAQACEDWRYLELLRVLVGRAEAAGVATPALGEAYDPLRWARALRRAPPRERLAERRHAIGRQIERLARICLDPALSTNRI